MSKIRMSCDDGCSSDVRVAELAKKYDVECVFYWPVEWHSLAYDNGYEPLNFKQALNIAKDFEVGSHTITHRHLTKINHEAALDEIYTSKTMLESFLGKQVKKFCPPRGYTNISLTEYTLQLYESQRLTRGSNLVHVHPNSGGNENHDWREWADSKVRLFDEVELWFHSWELDKYKLWGQLEDYLKETA